MADSKKSREGGLDNVPGVKVGHFTDERRPTGCTAILTEEPEPLSTQCEELPPAIEFIVHRCLEKNPDNRFESARDVAYALRALSETSTIGLPPVQRFLGLAHPVPGALRDLRQR